MFLLRTQGLPSASIEGDALRAEYWQLSTNRGAWRSSTGSCSGCYSIFLPERHTAIKHSDAEYKYLEKRQTAQWLFFKFFFPTPFC